MYSNFSQPLIEIIKKFNIFHFTKLLNKCKVIITLFNLFCKNVCIMFAMKYIYNEYR